MNASIIKELRRLRSQLTRSMKKMSWDSGFKTTKRSYFVFRIQAGRVKLATVRTSICVPLCRLNWRVEVLIQTYDNSGLASERVRRRFYLSHTKSIKAWFRNILTGLKKSCVSRVMLT
jgi:hypothetical protein